MPESYYQDESVTLYHGDALEVLPQIATARLVVTDPPYAFGLASTGQEGKAGGWGDLMNNAHWYSVWLREARRLTANKSGAAWIFNAWRSLPTLMRAAAIAQWGIESVLVWDKMWIGPGGQRGLRPSYELVALFAHGDFALKDRGLPDIWRAQWASHRPNGHPAEKPVPLLRRIVRESGGGLVVDPFMGSGSTLVAARLEGQPAIGIEIEERWCEVAAKRCAQRVMELPEAQPALRSGGSGRE